MEQTNINTAPQRPEFLKVLCILTFIGCGIGIVFSIVGFIAAQAAGVMMGMADGMAEGMSGSDMSSIPGMEEAMETTNVAMKYAYVLLGVGIAGALLCLVGALQMWKMKKNGFYIYVVGELVPPVLSTVLMGMSAMGLLGVLSLIIPIGFTVMYALNLKHLS